MRYLAALVAVVILAAGACGPRGVEPIQGDELGPRDGETRAEYAARAQETLSEALADGQKGAPRFAVVTFRYPVSAAQAAEALAPAGRVNALIVGTLAPIAVPEAVTASVTDAGAEVTPQDRAALWQEASASEPLSAAVVWDTPQALSEIAASSHVLAVEPAPADAAWGSFAVRGR